MRLLGRMLIGATLVVLCAWASQFALGILAFANIAPRNWWAEHAASLFFAHEVVAYATFVVISSFLLTRVLAEQTVATVLACVALGLLVFNASLLFESSYYVRAAIGEVFFFNCAFLVGVPTGFYFFGKTRTVQADERV